MRLLTTGEVSKLLDLSADQVRRLEREGRLSAIRVGKGQRLFRELDVERLRTDRARKAQDVAP